MIYVYSAIPLRSMISTSCAWWRLPRTMVLSSTVHSMTSGSLRLPFMVYSSLPRHAAGCHQSPSPQGPPNPQLPGKASVLPRPDKLPSTIHPRPIHQNNVPARTACQVGFESLYRCSVPAPLGLDLSDPAQCHPGILWLVKACHSTNGC